MRGWSLLSGRRVFVALAVALLAGVSLSAGSAYASKTVTHNVIVESSVGFVCSRSTANPGFGTAQFNQSGSALTVKFDFVNGPPNTTVNVEITRCENAFIFTTDNLGTVRTNAKGQAKGLFRDTLQPGDTSYFLCLDAGFPNEWGTQPVPVA